MAFSYRGLASCGFILLGLACIALAVKDRDLTGPRGISVMVKGRSGRIDLVRKFNVTLGGGKNKPLQHKIRERKVSLLMDAIKEVDENGTVVGAKGRNKHSFNGFANQDFSFSDLVNTTFQGVDVHQFNFTASAIGGTGGTLTVVVYLFDQDGEISNGNETEVVKKGTFKFSIEIVDWAFCGDVNERCKAGKNDKSNETGNAIDFTLTLTSRGGKKRGDGKKTCGKSGNKKCPKRFDIGDGNMTLASELMVDGVWKEMAEGFPKFENQGNKNLITFRFPKFTKRVLYDPTITMGDTPPPEEPESTEEPTAGAQNFGLSITALILSAIIGYFHN